jgi:two-component system, NtrC family, C4-dicarboxylate transport response regulator DctD
MTGRVLLIDDDDQMRRSTEQALELAGLQVDAFASAEDALHLAGPGLNGVVISDIRMPGLDGMTLLQRLRDIDADLPVILITGHAEVSLAVEAMRRRMVTRLWVTKGFSMKS